MKFLSFFKWEFPALFLNKKNIQNSEKYYLSINWDKILKQNYACCVAISYKALSTQGAATWG